MCGTPDLFSFLFHPVAMKYICLASCSVNVCLLMLEMLTVTLCPAGSFYLCYVWGYITFCITHHWEHSCWEFFNTVCSIRKLLNNVRSSTVKYSIHKQCGKMSEDVCLEVDKRDLFTTAEHRNRINRGVHSVALQKIERFGSMIPSGLLAKWLKELLRFFEETVSNVSMTARDTSAGFLEEFLEV